MNNPQSQAIASALANNWSAAIEYNQRILDGNPNDIEALNRLAYAYTQIGNFKKACHLFKQVLSRDKYNQIAIKNLQKYRHQPSISTQSSVLTNISVSPNLFLEEPGKTKIVNLINVAPSKILLMLKIGQPVLLFPKRHTVEVRLDNKTYLGALPDDLSFHLRKLINLGNRYVIYIKSVGKNSVTIFIRELFRAKKANYSPTFSTHDDDSFYPYVRKGGLGTDESGADDSDSADLADDV